MRTEFERFMGQKKRRRDTLDRVYAVDYVDTAKYLAYGQILASRGKQQKLLFASRVTKVNERFTHQERVLLIGDQWLFNLKASKVHKPVERRAVDLAKLTRVSMSPFPDNYVVLHIQGEADLLLEFQQKTEAVQALRRRVRTRFHRELDVHFADAIDYFALAGRKHRITFAYDRALQAVHWKKLDRHTMHVAVGVQ